jgi:phosphatidylinositol alpha-mannosyltransferase
MNRSYATLPVGLRLAAQVRRFVRDRDFDIVHCHGLFWPEISYWALRYSRSVNVVTFLTAGFKIHTAGSGLFRALFREELENIHGRIAISRRACQAFEHYVPGEYRIIPCGVDLTRFRPATGPDGSPKSRVQGPKSKVLFVGRLDARKGIEVLLRAMPAVLKALPDARLTVIGQGPMQGRARRLAAGLGVSERVDFAGAVSQDELPRFYAECDVYCAPSLGGETLGIVLLEAMASGVPVVASDIPGYDETIRADVDGLLTKPEDPAALAAALVRVLGDPGLRMRLARAGLARAVEYAWPAIARKTLDFYRELLETAQSGPASPRLPAPGRASASALN